MREAIAYTISLAGEPVVEVVQDDPDRFDSADCLIYLRCDECNGESFKNNRCMGCGSVAPWAAKLGCGLA